MEDHPGSVTSVSVLPTSTAATTLRGVPVLRATLTTLPFELKRRLLHYAKLQDDAFRDLDATTNRYTSEELWTKLKAAATPWEGRTLYALAMTDRTMYTIASPILFESLSYKGAQNPIFGDHICPKHRQHFRTLKFRMSREVGPLMDRIRPLSTIALLLPIVNLEVEGFFFLDFLLPSDGTNGPNFFTQLATRITHLKVINVPARRLGRFVSFFVNLSSLEIVASDTAGLEHKPLDFRGASGFIPVLEKLSHLKSLSFKGLRDAGTFHPPPLPPPSSPSTPYDGLKLRTLFCDLHSANADEWSFFTGFPSVETLSIKIQKWKGAVAPVPVETRLPNLRTLTLGGYWNTLFLKFLPAFVGTTPSSIHLEACANIGVLESEIDSSIFDAFLPTLKESTLLKESLWFSAAMTSFLAAWERLTNIEGVATRFRYGSPHLMWDTCHDGLSPPGPKYRTALMQAAGCFDTLFNEIVKTDDFVAARKLVLHLEGVRAMSILKTL